VHAVQVDRHAHERVDRGERIGPAAFAGARGLADVGHVGRQLGDESLFGERLQLRQRAFESRRVRPVAGSSRGHVRTGEVHLERAHPGLAAERAQERLQLLGRLAADARDHRGLERAQPRQLLVAEALEPDILETDAVEHP
jgi:hypothetical protein